MPLQLWWLRYSIGWLIKLAWPNCRFRRLPGTEHRGIATKGGHIASPFSRGGHMSQRPVAIVMGSQSDWTAMRHAAETLEALGIGHDTRIVSAHRTPARLVAFAEGAVDAGFRVIIAGAGGAAHLPGMVAAMTRVPVLGVPVQSAALNGMDSLLSMVQMPAGIPVGTLPLARQARSTPRCWRRRSWPELTLRWLHGSTRGARLRATRWPPHPATRPLHDTAAAGINYRDTRRRPAGPDARNGCGTARLSGGDL